MRLLSLAAIGATVSILLAASLPAAHADTSTSSTARTITVSGDATVLVAPDVAYISVGVLKTDIDAAKAQDEANAVAARAIAAIKALGIPDRDLQTAGISLDPQYDDHNTLTGFQATDTLAITVENLKQTGPVIDAAVRAGANRSLSISFALKNNASVQAAALKAAVASAQHKAAVVASQFGISLSGAKFQVVESGTPTPQPYAAMSRLAAAGPAQGNATPVQTGTLSVQDTVTLTYTF